MINLFLIYPFMEILTILNFTLLIWLNFNFYLLFYILIKAHSLSYSDKGYFENVTKVI